MPRPTTTRGSHFGPNESTEAAFQAAVAAADADPNAPKFPFFGNNEIPAEIATVYVENMDLYLLQKQTQVEALRLQISQLKAENEFLAGRLSVNGYAAELLSFQLRALAIQGGLSNLMQRLATLSNYMSDFARAKEAELLMIQKMKAASLAGESGKEGGA